MAVVREKYWSGQSLTGRTGDYGLACNYSTCTCNYSTCTCNYSTCTCNYCTCFSSRVVTNLSHLSSMSAIKRVRVSYSF